MTLEEIRANLQAVLEQVQSLIDGAVDENGEVREMTEDEEKQVEELEAQAKSLRLKAKTMEAVETRRKALTAELMAIKSGTGRRTQADNHNSSDPDVVVSEPWTTARRTGRLKNFKGVTKNRPAEQRAYDCGMWFMSVLSRSMPGRFNFPRAVQYVDQRQKAFASEGDNSAGGFAVPEEFGTDIVDLREARGVARRVLRVVPMTSDTRTDPRREGGLTATWTGEGAAMPTSAKTWGQIRLVAKKLTCIAPYTIELSEDAAIDIGDDLAGEIAYAFADAEDQAAFNGDGALTYGGIVGIRQKLLGVSGGARGLVTQATGNTWDAIVLSDFNKVVGRLPQYADTSNVVWLMHRTFFYDVAEKLSLASGGTSALEVRDGERRPRPVFLGYPVEFAQVLPNATATGSVPAMLGDFGLGARLGDRRSLAIDISTDATVNGINLFEQGMIGVRGIERIDINIHDVGDSTDAGPIVGLKTGAAT
jgi:HK97 family phage major capsid protein